MNTVAKQTGSSAIAALQSLKSGLVNVQSSLPATSGDPLLRMGRDGLWVYGPENVEVEEGSLWAVNPMSIKHGYVCWTDHDQKKGPKKNELLGERMVPMTQPKPAKEQLPDLGWDWVDQVAFDLVCVSGEDKGEQVSYKTTSVGGVRAVHGLIDMIIKQIDADPGNPVPCITLETDTYDHKVWGKTYVPIFQLRNWVPLTDDLPSVGDAVPEDSEGDDDGVDANPAETGPVAAEAVAAPRRRRGAAEPAPATIEAAAVAPASEGPAAPRRRRRAV